MRLRILSALAACLASTGLSLGQQPAPSGELIGPPGAKLPPSAVPLPTPATPTDPPLVVSNGPVAHPADCGLRVWVSTEYLLWWFKGAPLGTPLATIGAPADTPPGALGQPGTMYASPNRLNYSTPFAGGRITAGLWLNDERTVGVEASGFVTERRTVHTGVASAAGGPVFYVPFQDFSTPAPAQNAFPFGAIGSASGAITATERARLWGTEANTLFAVADRDGFRLSLLAGARYLDLLENLDVGLNGIGPGGTFTTTSLDRFSTRNQFYGGQLGVRAEKDFGKFFASITGNVAIGDMHETVIINGITGVVGPGVNATTPGGFFAQTTNSGTQHHDMFAVVPQVTLRLGYNLTANVRVFGGYDFLYLSDVVRPGSQIDPRINFNNQAAPVGGGTGVGPPLPQAQFNRTDFWAQGFNFGLQLRY